MPVAFKELVEVGKKLEKHYRNMQDIEFTISRNKLYMLQTRNAKRTGFAAVRVATDLVEEGIDHQGRSDLRRKFIPAGDLSQLLQPLFDIEAKKAASKAGKLLTKGIPAGPGAATGKIVFARHKGRSDEAGEPERSADPRPQGDDAGRSARHEGGPRHPDRRRRRRAARRSRFSRQMGKVCIVGAGELNIDYDEGTVTVKGQTYKEGDDISLDGFTGEVFAGPIATSRAKSCKS